MLNNASKVYVTQWQPFALPTNGMANPDTWREWAQVKVVMMISSMMVVIIIISCTVSIIDIISSILLQVKALLPITLGGVKLTSVFHCRSLLSDPVVL